MDQIIDDRISIKEIFLRIGGWIKYLFRSWKGMILVFLLTAGPYYLYNRYKTPVYTAETTFILEGSQGARGFSSLASAVGIGVDINSGTSENPLFDTDHIIELYKSFRMLNETFLAPFDSEEGQVRLITRYITEVGLLEKWNNSEKLAGISFEIPTEDFTITHDSLMLEVIDKFRKNQLAVSKLTRQLDILSVRIYSEDQLFAAAFDRKLVENVNDFYSRTMTKKTSENLNVLQRQTDSINVELEVAVAHLAGASPMEIPRARIRAEALGAVFQEVTKNLEIAKISHQRTKPLIQIIDEPIMPLDDGKHKSSVLIILSIIVGGFLSVAFFTAKLIYVSIMSDPKFS